MPMGLGYGAAVGLEDVLARLFKEQVEKQRQEEARRTFEENQRQFNDTATRDREQFATTSEIARGNLAMRGSEFARLSNQDEIDAAFKGTDIAEGVKDRESRERIARMQAERSPVPVVIQTPDGPQILDRRGGTTRPITDQGGRTVETAPTAARRDMLQARKDLVPGTLKIKDLSERLIQHVGPAQRAVAAGRSVESFLGADPEFRAYQSARYALAGNLAVAQQGSRPSDADIQRNFLPLVPDVFADTTESAAIKWDLIAALSHLDLSSGGTGAPAPSASSGDRVDELIRRHGGANATR